MSNQSGLLYSSDNPSPYKTLLLYDRPTVSKIHSRRWTNLGIPNRLVDSARQAVDIRNDVLSDFDVAVVHLSLGDREGMYGEAIKMIGRLLSANQMMRILILTGGGYTVRQQKALDLPVNGLFSVDELDEEIPPLLLEVQKGPLNPEELEKRGRELGIQGERGSTGNRERDY